MGTGPSGPPTCRAHPGPWAPGSPALASLVCAAHQPSFTGPESPPCRDQPPPPAPSASHGSLCPSIQTGPLTHQRSSQMLDLMRKVVPNLTPHLPGGTGLHTGGPTALGSGEAAGSALGVPSPHPSLHLCDLKGWRRASPHKCDLQS